MDPSYNNPFGSFGANSGQPAQPVQPSQPIMSPVGSGDIVLPGQQKKKKTGLIIGIVLIIIAVVVGIIAAVVFLTPKKDNVSYEQRFNKYANDLMFGEQNTEKTASKFNYYTTKYINNHYEDLEYIGRLKIEYEEFYEALSKADEQLANEVAEYSPIAALDFIMDYDAFMPIDKDYLETVYAVNGSAVDAYEYIENYYPSGCEEEDECSENYQYEEKLIESIKSYDKLLSQKMVEMWASGGESTGMYSLETYARKQIDAWCDDMERDIEIIYSLMEGTYEDEL